MKKSQIAALVATVAILSACGAGRVMVMEPVKISQPVTGVTIERDQSTVDVPTEITDKFETHLREKLRHLTKG